jgi:aerobic carbon-monoxide dehydrogenase small subunit
VRHGLEGNLCRCTGYHNIVKAVLSAAQTGRGGSVPEPEPSAESREAAQEFANKGLGA